MSSFFINKFKVKVLKIAMVLFGNLRTFKKCSSSIQKCLNYSHQIDFYLHTWNSLERNTESHKGYDRYLESKSICDNDIIDSYPNISYVVDETLREQNKRLSHDGKYNTFGAECMYDSMSRALKLMVNSKKHYDLVIITRPDILLKDKLNVEEILSYINNYPKPVLFRAGYFSRTNSKSVNYLDSWGASDCLMLCNLSVATTLSNISDFKSNLTLPYVKWVESQLDYFLIDHNIKTLYLNYTAPESWAIVRRAGENSKLHIDILQQGLCVFQSIRRTFKILKSRA